MTNSSFYAKLVDFMAETRNAQPLNGIRGPILVECPKCKKQAYRFEGENGDLCGCEHCRKISTVETGCQHCADGYEYYPCFHCRQEEAKMVEELVVLRNKGLRGLAASFRQPVSFLGC